MTTSRGTGGHVNAHFASTRKLKLSDSRVVGPWHQRLAIACSERGVALCAGRVLDRSKVEPKRYKGGGWLR